MRLFILLGLIFGLSLAPSAKASVFNPESFTLDNGMQVVLISNTRVPVVNHMVWYKVGSADEPKGQSGIAHYFEHLMFKGTKTVAPGEFSRIVARLGGRDNAFTSFDFTGYTQTVAKEHLATVMRLEADRMTNLTLDPAIIEPERQVVLEERRTRVDNEPGSLLSEQVGTALFMNYPYRIPIIGWAHEIEAITLENLQAFYRKWYTPNNAILLVEGDVTLEELKPLAEKYYGVIARGPEINRLRPAEPPSHADRRIVREDPRVRQPALQRIYLAPSYKTNTGDARDPYALQVLESILSSGATSRLNRSLVIDQKVALGAGMYYSPSNLGPSRLGFYISPAPGVTIEEAEAKLIEEINLLLEKGVSQDEVTRAQKSLTNEAIFARDRLGTAARVFGNSLSIDVSIDQVESWPAQINSVTVQQVNAAAKRVLENTRTVTSILKGVGENS